MTPRVTSTIALARETALRLHAGQLYGTEPYEYHLLKVIAVLVRFGFASPILIAAAWLHDVLEDTFVAPGVRTSKAYLIGLGLPKMVVGIAYAVTDEDGATRKERKARTYLKIAAKRLFVILKLADRIANVEEGGKVEMYRAEHEEFRKALFNPAHRLDAMWSHLDGLLGFKGR